MDTPALRRYLFSFTFASVHSGFARMIIYLKLFKFSYNEDTEVG